MRNININEITKESTNKLITNKVISMVIMGGIMHVGLKILGKGLYMLTSKGA